MKVILSRKGFDSEYGGIASPILPDKHKSQFETLSVLLRG